MTTYFIDSSSKMRVLLFPSSLPFKATTLFSSHKLRMAWFLLSSTLFTTFSRSRQVSIVLSIQFASTVRVLLSSTLPQDSAAWSTSYSVSSSFARAEKVRPAPFAVRICSIRCSMNALRASKRPSSAIPITSWEDLQVSSYSAKPSNDKQKQMRNWPSVYPDTKGERSKVSCDFVTQILITGQLYELKSALAPWERNWQHYSLPKQPQNPSGVRLSAKLNPCWSWIEGGLFMLPLYVKR